MNNPNRLSEQSQKTGGENPQSDKVNRSENRSVRSDFRSAVFAGLLPLRILGSLTFGIVLMTVLMVILAWGTFVEAEYGRHVANFALYGSRWFAILLAFLAMNIACSTLLRFPWKRRHLPFLFAHIGILLLLLGSYQTWQHGHEAQITLSEGTATNSAIQMDKQHFKLQNTNFLAPQIERVQSTQLSFDPGPFNWEDYKRQNWVKGPAKNENDKKTKQSRLKIDRRPFQDTLWLAMQWGNRDLGVLPTASDAPDNLKNVKLEVLDYLASSATLPVPPLDLNILWKRRTIRTETELGEVQETPRHWERVKLAIKPQDHPGRLEIRGTRSEQLGGERVCYYMTTVQTEVNAFLAGAENGNDSPGQELGESGTWGRLTLYFDGRNYDLNVDDLLNGATAGRRLPLKGTGFEIGDVRFRPRGPLLQLTLFTPTERETLTFYPDMPDMNVQAPIFGVFGTYQIDPTILKELHSEQIAETTLDRLAKPRLEILQGPDRRLYYRYWNGTRFVAAGSVPNAKEVAEKKQELGAKPSLTLAADSDDEVNLIVEQFIPQDLPGMRIVPLPVGRKQDTVQRAKIRLVVDGKEDVFWLRPVLPTVVSLPPERDQVRYVHGQGRTVQITWDYDRVSLGFGIFLKQFEKRMEPGTAMPSHYSSLVDFIDMPSRDSAREVSRHYDGFTTLQKDVLIKMNQPAVFQGLDRRYRIYQSSCSGPYHPGDFRFQELYDGTIFPWEQRPRESIYMSTLSVNDDPGRGLKYLGSFLMILGIAWFCCRKR